MNIYHLLFLYIYGIVSHYFYDFSKQNTLIGLISPVNESVWEHYKLLFFPILFLGIYIGIDIGITRIIVPLCLSLFHGMVMIFGIFYLYINAFSVKNILIIDIISFFITITVSYIILLKYSFFQYNYITNILGFAFLVTMIIGVFHLTYHPKNLPLFIDNSNKGSKNG